MVRLYQEWSEKAGGQMGLWNPTTHWLASKEDPILRRQLLVRGGGLVVPVLTHSGLGG